MHILGEFIAVTVIISWQSSTWVHHWVNSLKEKYIFGVWKVLSLLYADSHWYLDVAYLNNIYQDFFLFCEDQATINMFSVDVIMLWIDFKKNADTSKTQNKNRCNIEKKEI